MRSFEFLAHAAARAMDKVADLGPIRNLSPDQKLMKAKLASTSSKLRQSQTCTPNDSVLLAALPEEEARAVIDRPGLAPRTPRSLTSPSEIMARVADARRLGYALIDQEVEIGLRAIAVPLLSVQGRVVAALNTGVAAVHSEPELLVAEYLPELLKVQDGLKRVLR